jgi:hypothetical protein
MKENTFNNNDGGFNTNPEIKIAELPNYSNYVVYSNGAIYNKKTNKFIGCGNENKYITVAMKNDNGQYKFMSLHKVIYEAFNGEVPNGKQINHKSELKN